MSRLDPLPSVGRVPIENIRAFAAEGTPLLLDGGQLEPSSDSQLREAGIFRAGHLAASRCVIRDEAGNTTHFANVNGHLPGAFTRYLAAQFHGHTAAEEGTLFVEAWPADET